MRATPTIFACLGFLMEGPASGYDILKAVREGNMQPFVSAGQAAIYDGLRALEGEDAVTSKRVLQSEKPSKVLYTITESGKVMFRTIAAELITRDTSFRTALLIVRFHAVLPARLTIAALERQLEILERQTASAGHLDLRAEIAQLAPAFQVGCARMIDAQKNWLADMRNAIREQGGIK